ncbi:MAG: response regulator transcription factor, partial [Megamonas funiformis]
DIRMPKMDGVYCTKLVKEQYPEIKIVILTTFDDDEYIFSALKYGASGYLLKDVGMEELYEDIMVIYNGGALINPDIATKVVSMFSNMSRNRNLIINVEENCLDELSKNEWKIVQNIGLGLSNKEIAKKMFLSEGTVRNYLSSILSKLDLRDRTQLAIWAVQTGQIAKDFDND